jgi:hypothetical protein
MLDRFKYDPTVLKSVLFPDGTAGQSARKRRKVEAGGVAAMGDVGDADGVRGVVLKTADESFLLVCGERVGRAAGRRYDISLILQPGAVGRSGDASASVDGDADRRKTAIPITLTESPVGAVDSLPSEDRRNEGLQPANIAAPPPTVNSLKGRTDDELAEKISAENIAATPYDQTVPSDSPPTHDSPMSTNSAALTPGTKGPTSVSEVGPEGMIIDHPGEHL